MMLNRKSQSALSASVYMKWIVLCCLVLYQFIFGSEKTKFVLRSPFFTDTVKIDGILQEWDDIPAVQIKDRTELSDNTCTLQSMWHADYLYFAFSVQDKDLRAYQTEKDHKKLYLDDMVEFLLDTRMDRTEKWLEDDIIYHLNLQGQVKDGRGTPAGVDDAGWDGDARWAYQLSGTLNDTTDVDRGYTFEVAVPWDEIGQTPFYQLKMGLNFACGDNDGKGRMLFDWVDAWPTRSPHVFGTLHLKGLPEKTCGEGKAVWYVLSCLTAGMK
jgi:hypothetical protein